MGKDFLARHALVFLLFFSVSSFKWLKCLFFITFSSVSLFFGRLFAHLYETKNRGFVRYLFCYKSLFVGLHKFLRTVSGTLPFFLLHSDKFSLPKGGGGFPFPCKMCYNTPQKGRPLPAGHCPPQVGRPAGRPPLWGGRAGWFPARYGGKAAVPAGHEQA